MPIIKSDIRLIDGDVTSAAKEIKNYLPKVGYRVDECKISQDCTNISARTLKQSVVKLYLTNSPQIVHFHLKIISEWQIQIDTRFDLISKFRIFYFTVLFLFIFGSVGSLIIGVISIDSNNQMASLLSSGKVILFSVACFISACFFYLKSLRTFPYENLLNKFYVMLEKKGFSNRNDIHVGHIFPDMWKTLFILGFFFFPIFTFLGINDIVQNHTLLSYFLYLAFLTIGLLILLLIVMNFHPTIKAKMFFALAGFSFCIPLLLYFSPPAILSITGDLKELYNKYLSDGYPQEIIQYGSIFYLSSFVVIIIIAFVSLIDTLQLPIRLLMQLDKPAIMHPDSYFNRSFQSKKSFFQFNILFVFLWIIFLVVKVVALYFTLTIVEISLFGSNYIFNSNIALLFFENTKLALLFLSQSAIDTSKILIFHRLIMLFYSAPMLALIYLLVKKNIKSGTDEYRLAKNSTNENFEAEIQISKIIKRICEFAGIRFPIVRIIDSKEINAKVKFLRFPFFKNILIVSKGALTELNDNEAELEIMLAHEIGHIKKHTMAQCFLCFLSDYSFFGNGFLALLQNSYKIEREADCFAVGWILEKRKDKNLAIGVFKSLLEKVEESEWKNAFFQSDVSIGFAQLRDNQRRSAFFKMFNGSSKFGKLKINIKLFMQMFFGEDIQSYLHPSNNMRIKWIERKFNPNETN